MSPRGVYRKLVEHDDGSTAMEGSMTDASPPQQPTTAAGRRLLKELDGDVPAAFSYREDILAIEEQARAVEPPLPDPWAPAPYDAVEPPLPVDPDPEPLRTALERIGYGDEVATLDATTDRMYMRKIARAALAAPTPAPPALDVERLAEAMYADGCIKPPLTDHAQHVLARLSGTEPGE